MPTFPGALIELQETLKKIKNRTLKKEDVLLIFTGRIEDCPLCLANIEFGNVEKDGCKACPASYSSRSHAPCDRVKQSHIKYRENKLRRNQFEKIFAGALKESWENYNAEVARIKAYQKAQAQKSSK